MSCAGRKIQIQDFSYFFSLFSHFYFLIRNNKSRPCQATEGTKEIYLMPIRKLLCVCLCVFSNQSEIIYDFIRRWLRLLQRDTRRCGKSHGKKAADESAREWEGKCDIFLFCFVLNFITKSKEEKWGISHRILVFHKTRLRDGSAERSKLE